MHKKDNRLQTSAQGMERMSQNVRCVIDCVRDSMSSIEYIGQQTVNYHLDGWTADYIQYISKRNETRYSCGRLSCSASCRSSARQRCQSSRQRQHAPRDQAELSPS